MAQTLSSSSFSINPDIIKLLSSDHEIEVVVPPPARKIAKREHYTGAAGSMARIKTKRSLREYPVTISCDIHMLPYNTLPSAAIESNIPGHWRWMRPTKKGGRIDSLPASISQLTVDWESLKANKTNTKKLNPNDAACLCIRNHMLWGKWLLTFKYLPQIG